METIRGNTAEVAKVLILDDIKKGESFKCGRLVTADLAKKYKMSRTPVREALIKLAQDGIVSGTANAGFELKIPTLTELCDLYEIRELVEGIAVARLAARLDTAGVVARLRELCQARRNAFERGDGAELENADYQFHLLICESCGSELLYNHVRNYMTLSVIFRANVSFAPFLRQTTRDANDEHEQIVDAIERHEPKIARKLLAAHIAGARKIFEKIARKYQKRQAAEGGFHH